MIQALWPFVNLDLRMQSKMKGGDKFVSRQIDGKGIGVIAITPIKQGELVISEEPLLIIPWYIRQAVAGYPRYEN